MPAKNAVLIVASLVFYGLGEPVYVLLLVLSASANYAFGRWIGGRKSNTGRRWVLAVSIAVDLLMLFVFKYAGFFAELLNKIPGVALPVPDLHLPIGISFYTFQAVSYIADVYRGEVQPQRSFWKFLLYLSLFPQLIAGPIVRYSEIEPQLTKRNADTEIIFYGAMRFFMGLGKKVLLADYAGRAAALLLNGADKTILGSWLGVLLFSFEIYFDFSGYSDMAIGLGRVFGFKYEENFNLPYTAVSITDFWRRWHISLSGFFRDYVYIPLGGGRRHRIRNLFIVWLLTGLWHGASLNFVLWGLYFFVFLLLEKLLGNALERIPMLLRRVGTLLVVAVGWAVFYFTDLQELWRTISLMFGGGMLVSDGVILALKNNAPLLIVCILGCTPLPRMAGLLFGSLCAADTPEQSVAKQRVYCTAAMLFALLLLGGVTVSLVGSSYSPFLYFRF